MELENIGTKRLHVADITVETDFPPAHRLCCSVGCTDTSTQEHHILMENPNTEDCATLMAVWLCQEHEHELSRVLVPYGPLVEYSTT